VKAVAAGTDVRHGKMLYSNVCATCHGANGDLVAGHSLATLRLRRDLASTIEFIKMPVAPMPSLYPLTLNEQDVEEVAAYLQQDGWK